MTGRRRLVLAVVVLTAAAGCLAGVLLVTLHERGQGPSGSGLTYRGEFYAMSGAEVRQDRLGPVIDRDVPVMDATTDVREISGVDPDLAVAAHLSDIGGTAAEDGAAWLLMSPDADVAADPWAHAEVADAVEPR